MTWPLPLHIDSAIPGDGFDGWQNYWNLWWVKVALIDQNQSPFQTDLLYYPTGVDLYFHTLNPFNGVVTLPLQLSQGLLVAYNAVVFLSWTLAGFGVYLLTRWILRPKGVAQQEGTARQNRDTPASWLNQTLPPFLAGLIFTFAPFHMAHLLGHMQVMSLQWIPFYVLYLLRSLDKKRTGQPWLPSAGLASLFLVLCGLCDWYFVLYLFFFTGLLLLWHVASELMRSLRAGEWNLLSILQTWLLPPLVSGLLFLLLLSPILLPMIRTAAQSSFMVRPESDFYMLSASLADFLIPNRLHTLFREASFGWIGNQIAPVSERTIGIGYVALVLAGAGLLLDRKRAGFWAASVLFFGLMALGPVLHWGNITWCDIPSHLAEGLPRPENCSSDVLSNDSSLSVDGRWSLFGILNQLIPFMEISRSVSRYALMVQLCMAVLAGVGLSRLMVRSEARGQSRVGIAGMILLSMLVLAEYWVVPYPMSPPDTPGIYHNLAIGLADGETDKGAMLNLPMNYDRPGYLLYQTIHQRPLTVAYISRDDPRTLTERLPLLQHWRHLGPDILEVDPAQVGMTVLQDVGVKYVTLDRYKMPGGAEREYTTTLAQAVFANQAPFFEDDRITVYQVPQVPTTSRQPYPALGPLNWGPLQAVRDGTRYRSILDGPAQLLLNWGSTESIPTSATLTIQYRTKADAVAHLLVAGEVIELPAMEERSTLSIPLSVPALEELGVPSVVTIDVDRANELFVEGVEFVVMR